MPDNLIFLATGAFASQGYFNFPLTLILIIVTATISDLFGYWLVKTFGGIVMEKLRVKKSYVSLIHKYVDRYSGITIFLTRIAGPFGPVVNFLSGLINVPLRTFLFFDILGNAVDIILYLVAGYLLSNYWLVYSAQIGLAVAILGSLILITFIAIRIFKKSDGSDASF